MDELAMYDERALLLSLLEGGPTAAAIYDRNAGLIRNNHEMRHLAARTWFEDTPARKEVALTFMFLELAVEHAFLCAPEVIVTTVFVGDDPEEAVRHEIRCTPVRRLGRTAGAVVEMRPAAVELEGRSWKGARADEACAGCANADAAGAAQRLSGLRVLARVIDARDPSTQRHSERVAALAGTIARTRGWGTAQISALHAAALIHDVGKVGIPDAILGKPGRLSSEEFDLVKAHATLGAAIAAELVSDEQARWIRHHHERWDGRGYPDGLHGTQIPEGARIIAVADAWDAMTAARPYRAALATDRAVAQIREGAGTQFDPECATALLGVVAPSQPAPVAPRRWIRARALAKAS